MIDMKIRNLNWKYGVYIAVGVTLAVLTGYTADNTLSETDKEIYQTAIGLDAAADGLGFSDFDISEYKVRFYDGSSDFVVNGDSVIKEKSFLDTFVGTTVNVDGEFQVLLPTYEKFSQMFTALSAAGSLSEGSMSFEESNYSKNAHVATLWHEAFHTWQFNEAFEKLEAKALESGITEETVFSEIVLNEVDANKQVVLLYEEGMDMLICALNEKNNDKKIELIKQYYEIYNERKALLSTQAAYVEQYYETVEGSARYVEACIYRELEGDAAWEEAYMKPFVYQNGSGKYYEMGMLKCMLLDELYKEWKQGFDVTTDINEILLGII